MYYWLMGFLPGLIVGASIGVHITPGWLVVLQVLTLVVIIVVAVGMYFRDPTRFRLG